VIQRIEDCPLDAAAQKLSGFSVYADLVMQAIRAIKIKEMLASVSN